MVVWISPGMARRSCSRVRRPRCAALPASGRWPGSTACVRERGMREAGAAGCLLPPDRSARCLPGPRITAAGSACPDDLAIRPPVPGHVLWQVRLRAAPAACLFAFGRGMPAAGAGREGACLRRRGGTAIRGDAAVPAVMAGTHRWAQWAACSRRRPVPGPRLPVCASGRRRCPRLLAPQRNACGRLDDARRARRASRGDQLPQATRITRSSACSWIQFALRSCPPCSSCTWSSRSARRWPMQS